MSLSDRYLTTRNLTMAKSATVLNLDKRWYSAYEPNWDNRFFRELLLPAIDSTKTVLDYGAGRGHVPHMNFKGIAKFVAGIDPDKAVFENPYLDEAKVLELPAGIIPYPDATFDIVFADNVMEHIEHPDTVFHEIARVLKPGGRFFAKTPNKWHYVPLIARCTPTWFHKAVNKRRGREEHDTFPTCYACNSPADVQKYAAHSGLRVVQTRVIEGRPEYLRFNALTYFCGFLFERLVNSTTLFQPIRCVLMFEVQKP